MIRQHSISSNEETSNKKFRRNNSDNTEATDMNIDNTDASDMNIDTIENVNATVSSPASRKDPLRIQ